MKYSILQNFRNKNAKIRYAFYERCTKLEWDQNINILKIKKDNSINISDINVIYNGIDITENIVKLKNI